MLEAEGSTLESAADEACEQSERARELHGNVFEQESALVSTMQGVGALFSLLNTALEDENFVRDAETVVEAQMALEQEVLGLGSGKTGRISKRNRRGKGLPSAEARVRATPHRNRTPDEKRWLALDAVVNPQLYHHVTLAEAEEMRWDALYYTRLDREDILRVLSLPPQVQLALPFLHTPDEVAAHELLARYSLGISADHFAQLDKTSQDACENPNTASASSSMTAAAEAEDDGNTAPGSATVKGAGASRRGWRDDTLARATHRVLACMRRAAEAELASPEDRDDEEAVWCVLDRKLRPQLYRDSDESIADRAEEQHREADAREDARHTWLTTPTGNSPRKPAAAQHLSTAGGSRSKIETVVEQKRAAEGVATARRASEDRETLVFEVAGSFSEEYINALAASVSAGGLPEAGVEETGREQEGDRGLKATAGGEIRGPRTIAVTTDTGDDEARVDAARQRESSLSAGDDDDRDEKEGEQPERRSRHRRRRLVETVQRVLSRFLVAEEETPLGRDMTRSLAMLQEVALRLGRGQRDIFSGLNPQTALAALRSPPPSTAGEPASNPPTETNGSRSGIIAAEESGEGGMPRGEAPYSGRDEGSVLGAAECTQGSTSEGTEGGRSATSKPDRTVDKAGPRQQRLVDEARPTSDSGRCYDSSNYSTMSDTPRKLEKVFGSWEEIHPAALGVYSQEKAFREGDGEGTHPASFRTVSASDGMRNPTNACSCPIFSSTYVGTMLVVALTSEQRHRCAFFMSVRHLWKNPFYW